MVFLNSVYGVASVFILFDVLSGLLKAVYTGSFSSTIMRQGGMHKLAEILVLFLVFYVQHVSAVELGFSVDALVAVPSYVIIMELGSILENLSSVNDDLANILKPIFNKDKKDGDGN